MTTETAGAVRINTNAAEETPAENGVRSEGIPADSEGRQLEFGLRGTPPERPRRVLKTRRYAVARWWFARMRETVRSTQEWDGTKTWRGSVQQEALALSQPPTRLGERRAA